MIKCIIRLENDIVGKAGQLLILRENNTIHVVSPEKIEAIFVAEPAVADAAPKISKRPKTEKPPKAFGYYKTAEAYEKAKARGRHMAEVRARKRAEAAAQVAAE